MAYKTLLMLFIVLSWMVTAHAQNPSVLAVKAQSRAAYPGASEMDQQADLRPVLHPYNLSPTGTSGGHQAPARQTGPLPATITVLLAGVLTVVIMQTRR